MSTGHGGGLPDYTGGHGGAEDRYGLGDDPYAASSHPMGPPQYGAFPPPLPSSNAALAGFVLGLAGLVMCGGLTSPFGIWFSAVGMKDTGPEASMPKGGRGLAVAGLVTSLIGLIPLLFVLLYLAVVLVGILSAAMS